MINKNVANKDWDITFKSTKDIDFSKEEEFLNELRKMEDPNYNSYN